VTDVRLASIDQVNEVTKKVYATFEIDKILCQAPRHPLESKIANLGINKNRFKSA
jgi:hypothetical protein